MFEWPVLEKHTMFISYALRHCASCCLTPALGGTERNAVTEKWSICAAAAGDQLVSDDLTTAGSWEANVKRPLLSISLKDFPTSDLCG